MPTDIWSLPKDPSSGAVRGSYFLRHSTDITGTLGFVAFENGRSTRALTGRELLSFVATLGHSVDLEPADDAARAALGLDAPAAEPEPASQPEATAAPEQDGVRVDHGSGEQRFDDPQPEAAAAPQEEPSVEVDDEPTEPRSPKRQRRGR